MLDCNQLSCAGGLPPQHWRRHPQRRLAGRLHWLLQANVAYDWEGETTGTGER